MRGPGELPTCDSLLQYPVRAQILGVRVPQVGDAVCETLAQGLESLRIAVASMQTHVSCGRADQRNRRQVAVGIEQPRHDGLALQVDAEIDAGIARLHSPRRQRLDLSTLQHDADTVIEVSTRLHIEKSAAVQLDTSLSAWPIIGHKPRLRVVAHNNLLPKAGVYHSSAESGQR